MDKWISINDGLPKIYKDVLVCFEVGPYQSSGRKRIVVGSLHGDTWGPKAAINYKVTHWMPLPEPPK